MDSLHSQVILPLGENDSGDLKDIDPSLHLLNNTMIGEHRRALSLPHTWEVIWWHHWNWNLDLVICYSVTLPETSSEKNAASAEGQCLALPKILFRAFNDIFALPQLQSCYPPKKNHIKEFI